MKNHALTKNFLKITFIFILIITCMSINVFADPTDPAQTTTLPSINFKIRTTNVNGKKQVLIDCRGKDFTNLLGLDLVFSYDNNKLTPSYISGTNQNEILDEIDDIQYDKLPEILNQPGTNTTEDDFYDYSLQVLSDSFSYNSELVDGTGNNILTPTVFKYMLSTKDAGGNEIAKLINFTLRINGIPDKYVSDDGTDPDGVLLGTFSFYLEDGETIEDGDFSILMINLICDDGLTDDNGEDDDYSDYSRSVMNTSADDDQIEDIANVEIEKKGSISGTIETGYYNKDKEFKKVGKGKYITVSLYTLESVQNVDWTVTKTNYTKLKKNLPDPKYQFYTDENTEGTKKFTISDIEFGKYVMLISKVNYFDTIITNIDITNSENVDLDTKIDGGINLILGDVDGNGATSAVDKTNYDKDYKFEITKKLNVNGEHVRDIDENGKTQATDKTYYDVAYSVNNKNKQTKTLITLS